MNTWISVSARLRRVLVAALLGLVVAGLAPAAHAAIAFDSASSQGTTTSTSTVSWIHPLGSGADRVVVVGVAVEDAVSADANVASVTFNGTAMTAVPNSKVSGGGTGIIQTQLFYLLSSSLPSAGSYTVSVAFSGTVDGASCGAVSLTGVAQSTPEAVATKVDTSGADSISTNITTTTAGAWVLDVVGSGNGGSFSPGSGQTERWDRAASSMSAASSIKPMATAGATTVSQTHSGANRLAHSLAAFAASSGGGTVVAPTITTQPQSQTASVGSNVTFSVTASGTAPLSYQWRKDGTNLSGATSSSLTLSNVQASNAGSYSVVVSNSAGSITSGAATLTVTTTVVAPTITTQPQSQTVAAGGTATFSVTASGTAPLSYQWFKNGASISGATSASLALSNVQSSDAGSYSVTVSNSAGSAASSAATLTVTTSSAGDIYVSPSGTDSNPGTISQPTTLARAITLVQAGGTIHLRGGTYSFSAGVTVARGNDGSSSSPKRIYAYSGETAVLNFSGQAVSSSNRGLTLNGHYWHVRGLIVERAGDNGIYVGGNNNTVERCVTRFNADTGLQLGRHSSSAPNSEWPANNLILNCDSHDNKDPTNENADGFACKLTTGSGNVFRGCVAHHNIDDGWDLYTKPDTGPIGPVTIENCIAYDNGTLSDGSSSGSGDKNGYKLGGEDIGVNHIVRRSIAYRNGKHGFTFNRNLGSITFTNNTSVDNAQSNIKFDGGTHVFANNLSFRGGSSDNSNGGTDVQNTNVWWKNSVSTNGKGLVASTADFVSLTLSVSRNADGSLNLGNFLRLAGGSDLINAGTPSGTDIGAIESQ